MSGFRLREIRAANYRCFDEIGLRPENDTTLLVAENGGGKTALLSAIAIGLAVFQTGAPRTLKLDSRRDATMRTVDNKGRREPVGPCKLAWAAAVHGSVSVTWSTTAHPASGRTITQRKPIDEALERLRVPGDRWPLFAWYGVDRLGHRRNGRRKVERSADRWEAYASALDPISMRHHCSSGSRTRYSETWCVGSRENRSVSSTPPSCRQRSTPRPAS